MQGTSSVTKIRQPSEAQRAASDPGRSAWVSANAGSGKTSVLVDRVVRLLLSGAEPGRILCLTFTKAAAANMQNRVFDRLGGWVALPDAALADDIAALTGTTHAGPALREARRLFARAIETPGGLKIQTIHAFCERLLHLFPFEAEVPARFEMMDDAQTAAALRRATAATIRQALNGGRLADALETAAMVGGEDGVRGAIGAFVAHMRATTAAERKFAGNALRTALRVGENETVVDSDELLLSHGLKAAHLAEIVAWLKTGKPSDAKRAGLLAAYCGPSASRDARSYKNIFLNGDDEPRSSLATKEIAEARPDLHQILLDEQERVLVALRRKKAVAAAERTEAVSSLATEVLARYEAEKRRLGRLDFSDLILKTRALLTSDTSRWVIYKLDQGVDHILVDEAQDTSPEQWDIVKALSDEFFAGAGARGPVQRTVFAVGDEKQSIFSFQGARPEAFDAARRYFEHRVSVMNEAAATPHLFQLVPLETSYRTTPDVLKAVDQIFLPFENHFGLTSETKPTIHEAMRRNEPGLVELWPSEEKQPASPADAMAPVDALPPDSPQMRLADRIARRIRFWLDNKCVLESTGKAIEAGDVLVLVRNRNGIFQETIKALKRQHIPVAGADRMKLLDQIAVRDLLSLGRWCVLQEDDLALAEALRSPLLGLGEDQLETVAADRGILRLIDRLREAAAHDANVGEAVTKLQEWRNLANASDPLQFYSHVLSAGGRARLIGRLGRDAADAIDVFLYRLRAWQAANPPSLTLFLDAMAGDDSDVKRDMEEAFGRVRVMTAHASKGLEAPIVFLADIHHKPGHKPPRLFEAIGGQAPTAVWATRKRDDPPALEAARSRWLAAEAAEHRRLLYVALTRARDRLYICGAAGSKSDKEHWRSIIDCGLAGCDALRPVPDEVDGSEVLQWRITDARPAMTPARSEPEISPELFDWLRRRPPPEPVRRPPLRPSRIAQAAEPPPLRDALVRRSQARMRGDLIHLLLQRLPPIPADRRAAAGAALAGTVGNGLGDVERAAAVATAIDLMAAPEWASLFGADARTEVDVAGKIRAGGKVLEVSGRIDRLVIQPERITVLDYKTGRPPARLSDVPTGHLRQMAAYRALTQDLYPDRIVEAAILWTAVPAIAILDDAAMDEALASLS
jgi:ATP-dependent helicase/nuclease subunit A